MRHIKYLVLFPMLFFFIVLEVRAQGPAVEIEGAGVLMPRMTTSERNDLEFPSIGLMVINSESGCPETYRGAQGWYELCDGGNYVTAPLNELLGGNGFDFARSVKPTADGGYVVAGTTGSSFSGDITEFTNGGSSDYWVAKIDAGGNVMWNNILGGSNTDDATSISPTSDGGFVVFGNSSSEQSGDVIDTSRGGSDFWAVKLDSEGELEWEKLIGGSASETGNDVATTVNGDIILVGYSSSSASGGMPSGDITDTNKGTQDYFVVKLNSSGTVLWNKLMGSSAQDVANAVTVTTNGSIVVAGHSQSFGNNGDITESTNSNFLDDCWIVSLDESGDILWNRFIGGNQADRAKAITATADGGVVIAATSRSCCGAYISETNNGGEDFWIVKLDSMGSILWDRQIGGSQNEDARGITTTPTGDIVVVGSSASSMSGDITELNNGGEDYWIVKMDKNGIIIWDRLIGSNLDDEAESVTISPLGEIIVAGHTSGSLNGDVGDNSNGFSDYWIVKLDSDGNIIQD